MKNLIADGTFANLGFWDAVANVYSSENSRSLIRESLLNSQLRKFNFYEKRESFCFSRLAEKTKTFAEVKSLNFAIFDSWKVSTVEIFSFKVHQYCLRGCPEDSLKRN